METILNALAQMRTQQRQDDRSIIERSVSFLLLALICIFALNSIGNVQKYVGRFHDHWTGDVLGIAFGTVVFVCAYIAATTHSNTRWVATVIGNTGSFIRDVASAWLMTDLSTSPAAVAMVQAAATLPVFLLAIPAAPVRLRLPEWG